MLDRYKDFSDKIVIQVRDTDHGPHDKVFGALYHREKEIEIKQVYAIICDDDLYYHPETVTSYQEMILAQKSPTVYTHFADEKCRLKDIRHIQGLIHIYCYLFL